MKSAFDPPYRVKPPILMDPLQLMQTGTGRCSLVIPALGDKPDVASFRATLSAIRAQSFMHQAYIQIIVSHVSHSKDSSDDLMRFCVENSVVYVKSIREAKDSDLVSGENRLDLSLAMNIGFRKSIHFCIFFVLPGTTFAEDTLVRALVQKQHTVVACTYEDHCDFSLVLIRREVFEKLNGFDESYDDGFGYQINDLIDRAAVYGTMRGILLFDLSKLHGVRVTRSGFPWLCSAEEMKDRNLQRVAMNNGAERNQSGWGVATEVALHHGPSSLCDSDSSERTYEEVAAPNKVVLSARMKELSGGPVPSRPHDEAALQVTYTGAFCDLSGYASAAREYVHSLDAAGALVYADPVTFEPWKPHGIEESIVDSRLAQLIVQDKKRRVKAQIIHLTPENYRFYSTNLGVFRIGYFAWEASRIPRDWANCVNCFVHEAWVPSQYTADACIASGVTVPVVVVPHAIPIRPASVIRESDRFVFTSILQWLPRKNPEGMLRAYLHEFSASEKVLLTIKTYRMDDSLEEKNKIMMDVEKVQGLVAASKGCSISQLPEVKIIKSILTSAEMNSLIASSDCYVTMTHAEGFGINVFDALAMGRPVICPNFSAFSEYLSDETAFLIKTAEVPVSGMGEFSGLYEGATMTWGDPDEEHCGSLMRQVMNDSVDSGNRAAAGQQWVAENLSHKVVGSMMISRIREAMDLSRGWRRE